MIFFLLESCLLYTSYSDEKWVRFILNQLIANAVKYRTEQPVLRISTHKRQDQVVLVMDSKVGTHSFVYKVVLHIGTGNPHVHIMLTLRPLKENGQWGAKCRKAYDLDENGPVSYTHLGRTVY